MLNPRTLVVSAVAISALTLSGCAQDANDAAAPEKDAATTSAAAQTSATPTKKASDAAEAEVTFTDGVVRAMEGDKDMTAIFGNVTNNSDKDITLTGFSADVDAKHFEVHEVVDGVMREKQGGLDIPAGETVELKPGGEHLMIMGVGTPIKAGEEVDVTFEFADGSTLQLDPLPVRTMGAGTENYEDLAGHGGHGGHGMGEMKQDMEHKPAQ